MSLKTNEPLQFNAKLRKNSTILIPEYIRDSGNIPPESILKVVIVGFFQPPEE